MSLRTPLATARGLGSAKEGTQHFRAQRLTAIALVPLTVWFVVSVLTALGADYAAAVQWLASPLNAVLMLLFVVTAFYHAELGIQVVIEDYMHTEWLKISVLITIKFALIVLGLATCLAVVRIVTGV